MEEMKYFDYLDRVGFRRGVKWPALEFEPLAFASGGRRDFSALIDLNPVNTGSSSRFLINI